ncbi:hypothetical protein L1887_36757 [Cichorium endivia]|nr:hypothetical protein L1887_36757 [Cichorium endivia]
MRLAFAFLLPLSSHCRRFLRQSTSSSDSSHTHISDWHSSMDIVSFAGFRSSPKTPICRLSIIMHQITNCRQHMVYAIWSFPPNVKNPSAGWTSKKGLKNI